MRRTSLRRTALWLKLISWMYLIRVQIVASHRKKCYNWIADDVWLSIKHGARAKNRKRLIKDSLSSLNSVTAVKSIISVKPIVSDGSFSYRFALFCFVWCVAQRVYIFVIDPKERRKDRKTMQNARRLRINYDLCESQTSFSNQLPAVLQLMEFECISCSLKVFFCCACTWMALASSTCWLRTYSFFRYF